MKKITGIPPNYFFICIILSVAFYFLLPEFNLIRYPYSMSGWAVMIVGLYLIIWPWYVFKKHNTPEDFSKSTYLVTEGPYKFSRNPMYLGMAIFLLGLSIAIGNVIAFISPIFFFLIIHYMFIPFEEEKTQNTFGQKYLDYKKKVRRWI